MASRTLLLLPVVLLVSASLSGQQPPRQTPTDPTHPALNQGPKDESVGSKGMVSTQLASSTLTALEVLEAGGNAVDAAIAAAFLQQVDDYHMVFLFGSMSALYYDAASNRTYAISAVAQRPRADRDDGKGDASKVAVGGTVRGLAALHKRFGTRPWSELVQPAVAAAEAGAAVTSFMYGLNFALFESGVLDDGISKNAEARAFYMPDGHLVPVGRRWKMPALAATLKKVATDPDHLYTGEWGRKFVDAAVKAGGKVTRADLAEYQPMWDEPVRFAYRGHDIIGSPAPDSGGLIIGYNLNILENFDLKALGHYAESAETLEIMARAFDRVGTETRHAIRDPLNFHLPSGLWLSKDYGRMGAQFVRETMPRVDLATPKTSPTAGDQISIADGAPEPVRNSRSHLGDDVHTGSDHIVIADAHGNWISMLHTIHGGAPGVFIDGVRASGTAAQAATVGPGRRIVLPISAVMILRDGKPWLAMGTPGNPPQPVTQVLVNMIDFGMAPKAAAEAPRFWAFRGDARTLDIESRIRPAVRERLRSRGIAIQDLGDFNYHTGSMQIVWRGEDGKLHGVSDPRRLGFAAGY